MRLIGQAARSGLFSLFLVVLGAVVPLIAMAAPYAAYVMDARTGEVIHSRNADTRLHPASLTKMMTLYVAFVAIQRGEISLDTEVTITRDAAAEPPSRLGLQAGQTIRLRYLLRAAAVKSANDAATAIGIAIGGSEEAFAARMNATAAAMGMVNTHFITMHGLTVEGHYSSAHDMSILGRHLIYDFPQYYNLFSRRTADAGIAQVNNTNTRFLDSYRGADGIKTGYTVAAGYNLTASAERDGVRIIATVFGGTSTANRNAQVSELLDMGFAAAPAVATVRQPGMGAGAETAQDAVAAALMANAANPPGANGPAARTIRVTGQVNVALRPVARPGGAGGIAVAASTADAINAAVGMAVDEAVDAALAEALGLAPPEGAEDLSSLDAPVSLSDVTNVESVAAVSADLSGAVPTPAEVAAAAPEMIAVAPPARPAEMIMTAEALAIGEADVAATEVVTRMSTSDPRTWGINVGSYNSQGAADRVLIQVAVAEAGVLDGGVRRITRSSGGFDANIMGLNRDAADLACRRLQARGMSCFTIGSE